MSLIGQNIGWIFVCVYFGPLYSRDKGASIFNIVGASTNNSLIDWYPVPPSDRATLTLFVSGY